MRLRVTGACILVALTGAAVASAGSSNVNVQGSIKDSDGGKVSMTIKVKKRADGSKIPSKATNIKLINVPYVCNDGSTGSMSGETGSAKITFDAEVSRYQLSDNDQAGPELLFAIDGIVSKDGRKVTGKASVAFAETTNGVTKICSTSDIGINAGAFTAKK